MLIYDEPPYSDCKANPIEGQVAQGGQAVSQLSCSYPYDSGYLFHINDAQGARAIVDVHNCQIVSNQSPYQAQASWNGSECVIVVQ